MLVLTRKKDQTLVIGDHIEITVLDIQGDQIRLGIDAPKSIKVFRKEIYLEIQEENKQAARARGLTASSSLAMESSGSSFKENEYGGAGNALTESDVQRQNAEAKQGEANVKQQQEAAVSPDAENRPEPDDNPETGKNTESGKATDVVQREQPMQVVRAEAGSTTQAQAQTQEGRPERGPEDGDVPAASTARTSASANKPLTMMGRLLAEKEKEKE